MSVSPGATTSYTLTATNAAGTATATITVTVETQLPTITDFWANPYQISSGQSTTLNWAVSRADSVKLGATPMTGASASVTPTTTTTYTLTASNLVGSVSATLTVGVGSPGALVWTKTIVYGFGQELAEDQPGMGTTFIQSDYVGSPSITMDASGTVIGRSKNLPFGERMSSWGQKTIRRYTNHEDDSDSGAIYMQAREQLPAYGKFAEVDPAYDQTKDDPESWNLYNYVTNNPVTHTDPDGRIAFGVDGDYAANVQQVDDFSYGGSMNLAASYFDTDPVAEAGAAFAQSAQQADRMIPDTITLTASQATSGSKNGQESQAPSAKTGDGAWYKAVAGKDSVTIWKMEYVEGGGLCLPQDIFGGSYAATDMTVLKANGQGNVSMYDMAGLPGAQFQISTVNMPKSESFVSTKDAANFFNLASDYHQQFPGSSMLRVNSANRNDGALFGSHTHSHNTDRPAIDVAYQNSNGSNLSGHSASKLADAGRAEGLLSLANHYGFGRTVTYIEGIGSYQLLKSHDNHIHLGEGDVQ